jgi:carbon-monoxide dehydrogenase medium subunit
VVEKSIAMSLTFLQPSSLPEALAAVAQYGDEAKIVAGGTAVVLMLQQKLIAPQALISLGRVPGLDAIRTNGDTMSVGPVTRLRQVAQSPQVRQAFPALAYGCSQVGNVRIRNQATLGGNLAEADYASDPPAILMALEASVRAEGPAGARHLPLSGFFQGLYTTALDPDELITEILIPVLPDDSRMAYLKYKSRSSEDRPCVGVAAVASFNDGNCAELRLCVGAACEVPQRLPQVEALARGYSLSETLIGAIAEGYATNLEMLEDLRGSAWYRSQMVRVLVRRALMEVSDVPNRDEHR